jgi:hypothetical protein
MLKLVLVGLLGLLVTSAASGNSFKAGSLLGDSKKATLAQNTNVQVLDNENPFGITAGQNLGNAFMSSLKIKNLR